MATRKQPRNQQVRKTPSPAVPDPGSVRPVRPDDVPAAVDLVSAPDDPGLAPDAMEQYFAKMYRAECTPLSPDEAESVWQAVDEAVTGLRTLLARFVFVLEEHERLAEACSNPEAITSFFVESMLPRQPGGQAAALLPALSEWKAELAEFRTKLTAFYAGPKSADRRACEKMWKQSNSLLMRYPASTLKILEWYHVVSSCCSNPTPGSAGLLSSRLMPDSALCLETFREMKTHFDRLENLRQRILYSHLRLVISIASQNCPQSQQLIDVIQEGNIGLVKALDRFDYKLGHKFSTYATWWIRHEVMKAVARQFRVIRIPSHMIATISRINRAEQMFVKRFGVEPTVDDLARELDMPKARIHAIRQMARQQISLQAPLRPGSPDDSDLTQEDRLASISDNGDFDPEKHLTFQFLRDIVHQAVGGLSEREQKYLNMRFGLDGCDPKSIREIAAVFNLSRERIRQIENTVFKKIRLRYPELASCWQDLLD